MEKEINHGKPIAQGISLLRHHPENEIVDPFRIQFSPFISINGKVQKITFCRVDIGPIKPGLSLKQQGEISSEGNYYESLDHANNRCFHLH